MSNSATTSPTAADRFRRTSDVVWRVTSQHVLVHRIDPVGEAPGDGELVAQAALVWVAVEDASTIADISAATGLATADVERALGELEDADWVRPV